MLSSNRFRKLDFQYKNVSSSLASIMNIYIFGSKWLTQLGPNEKFKVRILKGMQINNFKINFLVTSKRLKFDYYLKHKQLNL